MEILRFSIILLWIAVATIPIIITLMTPNKYWVMLQIILITKSLMCNNNIILSTSNNSSSSKVKYIILEDNLALQIVIILILCPILKICKIIFTKRVTIISLPPKILDMDKIFLTLLAFWTTLHLKLLTTYCQTH